MNLLNILVIAERWFSVAERLYALIIGCMANYLGGSIGLIYPSFYFTKHSDLEVIFLYGIYSII